MKPSPTQPAGVHVLLDLAGCPSDLLADRDRVRSALRTAAVDAGATIVGEAFHEFTPPGVSGVVLVGESHLSVHTWPDTGRACLDVFTCSERFDARAAARHLTRLLLATGSRTSVHLRAFEPHGDHARLRTS